MTQQAVVGAPPRILYLSENPGCIEQQLAGLRVARAAAEPLRNDISTDEITPITVMHHIDDRLGDYPYVGFTAGGRRPIDEGAIRKAGVEIVVAGRRYGKGSSREHSPLAEKLAGVHIVFAESFERIYRQNADNVGLFTSTDMALLARIEAGDAVTVDHLVAERDPVSAAILRSGGLLPFGRRHLMALAPPADRQVDRPMTLAQKILARHVLATPVTGEDVEAGNTIFAAADWRFIIEFYTAMTARMMHSTFGRPVSLVEPDSILGFAEHFSYIDDSPAHRQGDLLEGIKTLNRLHDAFVREYGLKDYGGLPGKGSVGICHPVMIERHALPGQIVVGTDSHTPHAGAIGCLAFGVGATEMANAMLTGAVRLTAPPTILVDFVGPLPVGVTGKDLVLALLAQPLVRQGGGLGKVFEFSGEGVAALSIDERTTLTNMAAELGGFSGIVAPDAETCRFLKERRGIDFAIEPWMRSDPDAVYDARIEIDCAALSPMVARPGDPGNGVPLSQLEDIVRIDIAYGGSCTGGKQADFDQYHLIFRKALDAGRKPPPHVQLFLQFGSVEVRQYCERQGYLKTFDQIGATLLMPACGACANLGPGASSRSDQVTVSAQNRNFPGRSGPGSIWLASPATVAASAVAGQLISASDLLKELHESAGA
ncbi:aconitase family protein [Sphingobium sp.]|uniref:aconitase family protein n=1 Tax=Sphingobium sp. TaxID=1912891 RepID=UPI002D0DB420|nr:aconitase family protein [Sphingobium sp.]HUD92922.1 aconitase family protein [Sphingobium sp.]